MKINRFSTEFRNKIYTFFNSNKLLYFIKIKHISLTLNVYILPQIKSSDKLFKRQRIKLIFYSISSLIFIFFSLLPLISFPHCSFFMILLLSFNFLGKLKKNSKRMVTTEELFLIIEIYILFLFLIFSFYLFYFFLYYNNSLSMINGN